MSLLKMKQDISTTVAQQKYLESQKEQSDSATKLNDIQTAIKVHDYDIYKSTGISSNASGWPKAISDSMSMLTNQIKGSKGELLNKVAPEGSTTRNIINKAQPPSGTTLMKHGTAPWNKQLLSVPNNKVEEYKMQGWEVVK